MLSLSKLAVLALSATSAYAVSFTDVYNDLVAIDGQVNTLTGLANNYPGFAPTPGSALATIQSSVSKLISAINKASSDAAVATPTPVPTADAQKLYDYLCTTPLYPDAQKLVTATINKKSAFQANGVTAIIKTDCTNIKTAVDNLANVFIARAPTSTLKSNGQSCKDKYDTLLNQCISAFT